jgi:HK97 family phage major capsid protein
MFKFSVLALASGRTADILFDQEIDASGEFGISQGQFVQALSEMGDVEHIILRINSLGGNVFHGIGIYRALKRHKATVEVRVEGVAASAASVVAMAGDKIVMEIGSMMMIHKPWIPFLFQVDEDELLRQYEAVRTIKDAIVAIYAGKSGLPEAEVLEFVNETKWMGHEEAVEAGFADEVGEDLVSIDAFAMQMRSESAFDMLVSSVDVVTPQANMKTAISPSQIFNLPENMGVSPIKNSGGNPSPDKTAQRRDAKTIVKGADTTMTKLEQLRAEYAALQTKLNNIQDNAAAQDNRNFTADELASIKEMKAQQGEINAQIDALGAISQGEDFLNQSAGTQVAAEASLGSGQQPTTPPQGTPHNPQAGPTVITSREPIAPHVRGDFGYQNHALGRHAIDVANYAKSGAVSNNLGRIMAASGDLVSGTSGSDGGFPVAPDVKTDIYSTAIEQDPLLSRCWTPPTSSRSVQIPVDETQVWDSDRGIKANPVKEGGAATESKPEMTFEDIKLNKLVALVRVSDEMMEDAPFLDAYLRMKATEEINWKASRQVLFGTGAGEALGIFNSGAVATVASLPSQASDTIFAENVWDMEASMPSQYFRNAVWMHSGTSIRHLRGLTVSATSEVIGLDSLRNNDGGSSLSQRPLLRHELMKKVGDLNDLALLDFSQYAAPIKAGGIQEARSMHFEFDKSIMAFRFVIRFGGQPLVKKPALAPDGVTNLSPFVNLAAR